MEFHSIRLTCYISLYLKDLKLLLLPHNLLPCKNYYIWNCYHYHITCYQIKIYTWNYYQYRKTCYQMKPLMSKDLTNYKEVEHKMLHIQLQCLTRPWTYTWGLIYSILQNNWSLIIDRNMSFIQLCMHLEAPLSLPSKNNSVHSALYLHKSKEIMIFHFYMLIWQCHHDLNALEHSLWEHQIGTEKVFYKIRICLHFIKRKDSVQRLRIWFFLKTFESWNLAP